AGVLADGQLPARLGVLFRIAAPTSRGFGMLSANRYGSAANHVAATRRVEKDHALAQRAGNESTCKSREGTRICLRFFVRQRTSGDRSTGLRQRRRLSERASRSGLPPR